MAAAFWIVGQIGREGVSVCGYIECGSGRESPVPWHSRAATNAFARRIESGRRNETVNRLPCSRHPARELKTAVVAVVTASEVRRRAEFFRSISIAPEAP